jgi:hypothetical protein
MVVPSTRLSGREIARPFSPLPSWPDEDPAIQICIGVAHRGLDHRVSTLRVGPVMTEKNQARPKNGFMFPAFFVPDSRVPSTTMTVQGRT